MKHSNFVLLPVIVLLIVLSVTGDIEPKGSLVFVIDRTNSMKRTINDVKVGATAIFDTVVSSDKSPIENFVMVLFGDPNVGDALITKNHEEFKTALNSAIHNLEDGKDCPELAMTGIQKALEASLDGSLVYVFTDASAKDTDRYKQVKHLAQEKHSQLVFVLITGQCRDYDVYYKLADATTGQVFHLYEHDIPLILNYVEDSVASRSTTLHRKAYGVGNHSVEFEVDSRTSGVVVSLSKPVNRDEKILPTMYGPDNLTIDDDALVRLGQIVILKISDSEPGKYGVFFTNKNISSYVVITARSDVSFRHGFSTEIASSIDDTVFNPVPDSKNYLSIKLFGENVELTSVKFLDINYHKLIEMPLKIHNKEKGLYITDIFTPLHIPFRIVVKGNDTETGEPITRFGSLVLETETPVKKSPTVDIISGSTAVVEYGAGYKLDCEVDAYPEPKIMWKNVDEGKELVSSLTLEFPYKFTRILELRNLQKNSTYECYASNSRGTDRKSIQIEVKPKPYFNIQDILEDKESDYNAQVVLNCKVNSYPPAKISWFPTNKINFLKLHNNIELSDDNSTLIIKNMRQRDVGSYSCKIEYVGKPFFHKEPLVLQISINEGESATLSCRLLEGKPQPEIRWFRKLALDSTADFRELEEGTNLTTITLPHLNRFDTGIYKCVAQNVIGTDERYFNLSAECKPTIKNDDETIKISEKSSEVNIKCNVQGIPVPEVTWLIDEVPLEIDGDRITVFADHSLRLKEVDEYDTGIYTCRATNILGSAEKTVDLIVYYLELDRPEDSKIILERNDRLARLYCDVAGSPEPMFQWIFYSFNESIPPEILPETSHVLKLRHIQEDQRGNYTCVASNEYASINFTYDVDVQFPPSICDPKPYNTVVEGDRLLKIQCEATGNPKPTITWLMDGYPVKNDSNKVAEGNGIMFEDDFLFIYNITRGADEHKYYCEADNGIGRKASSKGADVIVLRHPPSESIKNTTDLYVERGTKTQIKCFISYERLDWLVWYKDGKLLHYGELEINDIEMSDEGIYTCRVSKQISPGATESANTNVIVGSKPAFKFGHQRNKAMKLKQYGALNCDAYSTSTINVTWWHNGRNIDLSDMAYYFIMDTESVGEYRCEVTNPFGNIRRTFDVTFETGDCLLNFVSGKDNEPLMLTISATWPTFKTIEGITIIPENEIVALYCPAQFTNFESTDLKAQCIGEHIFFIKGTYHDYSNINCKDTVKPRTRTIAKKKCLGDDTSTVKLVFDIGHKTIETFEYCLDKHANPIYAKYVMKNPSDNTPNNRSMIDGTELDSYSCPNQSRRFRKISVDMRRCCFAARHLVNPKDIFPGAMQRASYNRLNIVPHWSTCHSENWDEVEVSVRQLAKSLNSELITYTGTAGYWYQKLDGRDTIMSMKQKLPIATFLWKVIQHPATKSSIAIVQLNIPGISQTELESNYILCRDICYELPWMILSDWNDINRGYTYCCDLADFMTAFEKQRFDRDFVLWKVFEKYYNRLS